MSSIEEEVPPQPVQVEDARPATSVSLSERLTARAEELAQQTTVMIDVPGYEGILAAEYRLLSWQIIRAIAERHRKIRETGLGELRTAADTLITACVNIHEVHPDGRTTPTGESWTQLAKRSGAILPDDAGQRRGLLALFRVDTRVMSHYQEYIEWQQGQIQTLSEEAVGDFPRTG